MPCERFPLGFKSAPLQAEVRPRPSLARSRGGGAVHRLSTGICTGYPQVIHMHIHRLYRRYPQVTHTVTHRLRTGLRTGYTHASFGGGESDVRHPYGRRMAGVWQAYAGVSMPSYHTRTRTYARVSCVRTCASAGVCDPLVATPAGVCVRAQACVIL